MIPATEKCAKSENTFRSSFEEKSLLNTITLYPFVRNALITASDKDA
jgi:hypothetical protein